MQSDRNDLFVFYSDKLNYKADSKGHFIEGYISTGDLDLVNDIVTKSCMDSMTSQFDQRSIKLDFEHETFRGASPVESEIAKTRLPLGKAVSKEVDSKGVKVRWKMNESWKKFDPSGNVTMTFKDVWKNVQDGMLDAFSIAYMPVRTAKVQRGEKSVRMLDDVNLLNVALTGNAINPNATMTAVMAKSLEYLKSQEPEEDLVGLEVKDFDAVIADIRELKHKYMEKKLDITISKANVKKESKSQGQMANEQSGVKHMTDMKDEPVPPEGDAPAPQDQEAPPADAPADAAPEPDAPAEAEGKSVDLKSMLAEVKSLKEEVAALKAIVEKPLQKAKGAENKDKINDQAPEQKSMGPLDLIR